MNAPTTYPAVLIISRPPTKATPDVKVFIDDRILQDAVEEHQRLSQHKMAEAAYRTTGLYHYTAVPIAEAEERAAQIRAELEAQYNEKAEDAPTAPPASEPNSPQSESQPDPTTDEPECQAVSITVRYLGIPPTPTTAFSSGQLLQAEGFKPAHSVAQTRLELTRLGYKPDYTQWQVLDRGGQDIRRLEVYTRPVDGNYPEQLNYAELAILGAECRAKPITEEQRQSWLAADPYAVYDPLRPDPWYRKNWTKNRSWQLRGAGNGG